MIGESDRYVRDVMSRIHAPREQASRMEADLRAHLQAAVDGGETPHAAIARMGTPQEVAAEFMAQVAVQYAGFWRRFAGFGVDLIVIIAVGGALSLVAVGLSGLVPQHPQGADWLWGGLVLGLIAALALAVVGIIVLYFPVLEGRFGRTPGKRLLGLCVLREDGLSIGYKEAFLRRLPFYLEILPFDAIFIPFNNKRQRAFDIVARTVVVRE